MVMPVFLSVFSGCTDQVRPELDETHAKLRALQELAGAVNRDLTTLDLIVTELDDGHTILPESFQLTENGYEVSFRDGKKIVIPFGVDGVDGRTFIPVGVKDEDDLYYWQVDGEWLLDADGNRMRAGATDGVVPEFKVEDGFWWISVDGGANFSQLASCDEMDGMGVFRDVVQTAQGKVVLTLWDGETIELMSQFPFRMSFEGPVRDTLLIAPGEVLPIPYKIVLEGIRDPETEIETDLLEKAGRVLSVQDDTSVDFDFDALYEENRDNVISMYIERIRQSGESESVKQQALLFGMKALQSLYRGE